MDTNKIFKTAPLPFQGQKKRFIKEFKIAIHEMQLKGELSIIVDLFGGSGLLSHTAKRLLPDCKVIYNDFDDYSLRLANVERTNELLDEIRTLLDNYPRHIRLTEALTCQILDVVKLAKGSGFVDYITLSSSLLFSAKYVTNFHDLKSQTLYNNVKMTNYSTTGYLNGIEVVKYDYMELFEKFKGRKDVLFLIDPPYLSTDTTTYNSDKYWKLKDYLDVLLVLTHDNYIYFTSSKSQLIELCDWFAENYGINSPFSNAVVKTQQIKGKVINYTDMMLYRHPKVPTSK